MPLLCGGTWKAAGTSGGAWKRRSVAPMVRAFQARSDCRLCTIEAPYIESRWIQRKTSYPWIAYRHAHCFPPQVFKSCIRVGSVDQTLRDHSDSTVHANIRSPQRQQVHCIEKKIMSSQTPRNRNAQTPANHEPAETPRKQEMDAVRMLSLSSYSLVSWRVKKIPMSGAGHRRPVDTGWILRGDLPLASTGSAHRVRSCIPEFTFR